MRKGFLIVASFLLCSHAIAQGSPQDDSQEILEQAGCVITEAERNTVTLSCATDPNTTYTTSFAAPSACDPVEADKVEVSLERNLGEDDPVLKRRLRDAWDRASQSSCKAKSDEKCTFFTDQVDQGTCVFDKYEAADVTEMTSPQSGTFSATPKCIYKCKACAADAGTPAFVQSVDPAF